MVSDHAPTALLLKVSLLMTKSTLSIISRPTDHVENKGEKVKEGFLLENRVAHLILIFRNYARFRVLYTVKCIKTCPSVEVWALRHFAIGRFKNSSRSNKSVYSRKL